MFDCVSGCRGFLLSHLTLSFKQLESLAGDISPVFKHFSVKPLRPTAVPQDST
jgi:hypothetical protein